MKASIITKAPALILFSLAFCFTHAQTATSTLRHLPVNHAVLLSGAGQAVSAEWSVLPDNSLMCRFVNNGITSRAYYRDNGQWTYTVSGYNEDKLDPSVGHRVRSSYNNSSITYVEEIDMPNSEPVYIVEIQDKRSIKKLRVDKEEIEVIKELVKP